MVLTPLQDFVAAACAVMNSGYGVPVPLGSRGAFGAVLDERVATGELVGQ